MVLCKLLKEGQLQELQLLVVRGGFTVQLAQSTDVPSGYGFSNSAKLDVTTADATPDANGLLLLVYSFEGQDVQL